MRLCVSAWRASEVFPRLEVGGDFAADGGQCVERLREHHDGGAPGGRDERERAHVYRAALSQADTERRLLRELSERFFAGSAAQLALRALEMEKSSDEELDAIRKLIEKKAAASQ